MLCELQQLLLAFIPGSLTHEAQKEMLMTLVSTGLVGSKVIHILTFQACPLLGLHRNKADGQEPTANKYNFKLVVVLEFNSQIFREVFSVVD